jgi:hypothetical protein
MKYYYAKTMNTPVPIEADASGKLGNIESAVQRCSAWPQGIACACFFCLSIHLMRAYGLLHWRIIRDHFSSLQGTMKTDLFHLLGQLEVYHLTAILSVAFGVWAFWGKPRWICWLCLPMIIFSLLMAVSVM